MANDFTTVMILGSSIYMINCTFEYNIGSLYAFSANIVFNGIEFKNKFTRHIIRLETCMFMEEQSQVFNLLFSLLE